MIAVERSGSMNAKSPAVQLHFRKPPRKDSSPPFNYDARNDPALQHWFARPGIQKLVLPTELARPSLCARCNTPKESTCELCQTLFHDHIPPAPTLTLNPISTVIIHNSVSAPSLDSLTTLLTATGLFSNIQCMDVDQVVPTTEELQKYETILLIGNLLVPFSPKTLRNPPVPSWHKILRNHLSARQPGLVVTPTTFMSPLTPTMIHEALSPGLGRIDPEDHPMLAGVERLGMENSVWIVNGRAQKGAAVVARWGNGVPLVVVKGSLVAINMVVLPKYQSHHRLVDIWDPTHTDAVTLITNALRYVASLAEQQRRKTICDTCQTRPSSPGHNDWKTQRRVELEHAAKRRHRREIRYHEKVWAQYAESSRMKYHTPATPHQCELHEHGDGGPYDQHMSKPHQGGFLPQINVDSPYKRKSQPPTRQKADALPRFAQPEKRQRASRPDTTEAVSLPPPDAPSRRPRPEGAGKGSRQPIRSTTHDSRDSHETDSPPPEPVGTPLEILHEDNDEVETSGSSDPPPKAEMQTSGSSDPPPNAGIPSPNDETRTSGASDPPANPEMQSSGSPDPPANAERKSSGSPAPSPNDKTRTSGASDSPRNNEAKTSDSFGGSPNDEIKSSGASDPPPNDEKKIPGSSDPRPKEQPA